MKQVHDSAKEERRKKYCCVRGSSALNNRSGTDAFKMSIVRSAVVASFLGRYEAVAAVSLVKHVIQRTRMHVLSQVRGVDDAVEVEACLCTHNCFNPTCQLGAISQLAPPSLSSSIHAA